MMSRGTKMRFSIIIPVYNSQEYLVRCLDSVLKNEFSDFEVICVDDGSVDASGLILEQYRNKDSRVKVIHKQNGGVSSARNVALEIANGEYLCFCDSDDYVNENMLLEIDREIKRHNSDVVVFGVNVCKGLQNKEKIYQKDLTEKIKLNLLFGVWESFPWNKCFKRQLFANRRFPEGMVFEDLYLIPEICFYANKITVIDKALYFYNTDNGMSITSKMNSMKWFDFFYATKRNIDLCQQKDIQDCLCRLAEKRCAKIAIKCVLAHCIDQMLSTEKYNVMINYLRECFYNKKEIDVRNKFWIYLLMNGYFGVCKIYARFRGY